MRPFFPVFPVAALAALALTGPPAAAQIGGVWDYNEHVCGDCHGPHPDNPVSTLVYRGTSELASQFPGISLTSIRCLNCHGTADDRATAQSDRPIPTAGAVYLGPDTDTDHKLGRKGGGGMSIAASRWDPLRVRDRGSTLAITAFEPMNVTVNCTSCHDPHRPWEVTQQTELMDNRCLTCHDARRNQGDHRLLSCGICHRLHNGPTELFREVDRDNICGACHLGAPTPLNPGIEPVPGPPVHSSPSGRCRDCHQEH